MLLRLCTHFCVRNHYPEDSSCGNLPSNNNEFWKFWHKDSPSKAIAQKLSIEVTTVYWHLAILRKIFGVHSNIALLYILNNNLDMNTTTIQLTPRGKEVFELAMHGLTTEEISERLGISYSGVLRHKEKMLLVNKCSSMMELIAKYRGKYTDKTL